MAKNIIITIARQYGSGGREIGEIIAKNLGIPLYDKEIVKEAAQNSELSEEVLHTADESAANSLLYTLAMGSNMLGATMHFGYKMPINDKLFILQSDIIKNYASQGSCVIIGRCADYVLRDNPNLFRIFIYGDLDHRQERIRQRHPEIKSSQIVDTITKTLETPIEEIEFSVRAYNCLKRAGIHTMQDLIDKREVEVTKIRNLGKKSLKEVIDKVNEMGLKFRD